MTDIIDAAGPDYETAPIPRRDLATLAKPTHAQRARTFAHWGVANKAEIGYLFTGRFPLYAPNVLPRLPFSVACAGFVTMAFRYGGFRDPNGKRWQDAFTGYMLERGERVSVRQVGVDASALYCAFYGVTPDNPHGHHVGLVVAVHAKRLRDIITISHGNSAGPYQISVFDEARYQPGGTSGIVFKRYLPPA